MDERTAARGLAEEFYRVGVERTQNNTTSLLLHPTQYGDESLNSLGAWYRGLNVADRAFADQLVREAAIMATFGIAAMLDGATGTVDIEGAEAEPVLTLYGQEIFASELGGEAGLRVCPSPPDASLHDLFTEVVSNGGAARR